jgi:hypothetical protein
MAIYEMTDEQWFAEIELEQRRKRRRDEQKTSVLRFMEKMGAVAKEFRDGFSLPQGVSIKYAP